MFIEIYTLAINFLVKIQKTQDIIIYQNLNVKKIYTET